MHADNSICEDVTNILDIDVQDLIVEKCTQKIIPIVPDTSSDESEMNETMSLQRSELRVLCRVCSKPALHFTSYGGQVCSSCRSFFRRSVQSDKHYQYNCKLNGNCDMNPKTRINCKYCRYRICLKIGMKSTWVLSVEERIRRFKKYNIKETVTLKKTNVLLENASLLDMPFTEQEEQILNEIHSKLKYPYLKKFLIFEREAGVHLLEYMLGLERLHIESLEKYTKSKGLFYAQFILPTFEELRDICPEDVSQIMKSPAIGIAQYTYNYAYYMSLKEDKSTAVSNWLLPLVRD